MNALLEYLNASCVDCLLSANLNKINVIINSCATLHASCYQYTYFCAAKLGVILLNFCSLNFKGAFPSLC